MKYIVSLAFVIITLTFTQAQTRLPGSSQNDNGKDICFDWNKEEKLKADIEDIGLTVANKIMNCCSSWGGTNVGASIDFEGVRQNEVTGAFTIPMTVRWQGSMSGNQYWVQGKLLVYSDGSKAWLKIKDSGGFYPGCSKNCIR